MKGIIHSFESLAAVDGKGVRFAVFMAGCPLRCIYCHNPDTWQMQGKDTIPYLAAFYFLIFMLYSLSKNILGSLL